MGCFYSYTLRFRTGVAADRILSALCVEEHTEEYSLTSTLLHWIIAFVILWRVSCNDGDSDPSFVLRGAKRGTLLSLMEHLKSIDGECKLMSGFEEIIAATIFHLQQLLRMRCKMLPSVVAALSILLLASVSHTAGDGSGYADPFIRLQNPVSLLWSKIYYPPEANTSWRWSYDQPWADLTAEYTVLKRIDELHACQSLLVVIARVLGKKSPDFELLSPQELESSGLFEWEKTHLQK